MQNKNIRFRCIFPLLDDEEEPEEEEEGEDLIHQRLRWLSNASKASQEEFALQWQRKEPAESAHRTWAAVVGTQKKDIIESWLEMEKRVCARKLCAMWANIKAICKVYNIHIRFLSRGDTVVSWKFPHQATMCSLDDKDDACAALAEDGFPRSFAMHCKGQRAATETETRTVEDFFRK